MISTKDLNENGNKYFDLDGGVITGIGEEGVCFRNRCTSASRSGSEVAQKCLGGMCWCVLNEEIEIEIEPPVVYQSRVLWNALFWL